MPIPSEADNGVQYCTPFFNYHKISVLRNYFPKLFGKLKNVSTFVSSNNSKQNKMNFTKQFTTRFGNVSATFNVIDRNVQVDVTLPEGMAFIDHATGYWSDGTPNRVAKKWCSPHAAKWRIITSHSLRWMRTLRPIVYLYELAVQGL
jgi:hypothetical protein